MEFKVNKKACKLAMELYYAGELLRNKLIEYDEYVGLIRAIKKKYE